MTEYNQPSEALTHLIIDLPSVGTGVTLGGYCYPMLANGGYDWDRPYNLVDSYADDDEWYNALSKRDLQIADVIRALVNFHRIIDKN